MVAHLRGELRRRRKFRTDYAGRGYLIVGYSYLQGTEDCDVFIVKTDDAGHQIWCRTLGGESWDYGLDGALTQDGGYIIAGYTYSYGAGLTDVYLLKTDFEGNLIWQRTFGGSGYDFGRAVETTPDGGFFIAGSTDSFGWGETDAYLIKTNPNGEEIESWTFGGAQSDEGRDVRGTLDGGCILAGAANSFASGGSDVYLVRLAPISETERCVFSPPTAETSSDSEWVNVPPSEAHTEGVIVHSVSSEAFITFSLEQASWISLDLFDIRGRRVEVGFPAAFSALPVSSGSPMTRARWHPEFIFTAFERGRRPSAGAYRGEIVGRSIRQKCGGRQN